MELRRVSTARCHVMVFAANVFLDFIGGIIRFRRSLDGKFEKKQVKTDPFAVLLVDTMLPKNTF